jgi:hypothetical protein
VETLYTWPEDADHPENFDEDECSPSCGNMEVRKKSLHFRDQVTYMHGRFYSKHF